MNVKSALQNAQRLLQAAGVDGARRDARRLLAHCLDQPSAWLISHDDAQIENAQQLRFENMVAERASHRPVSQIIGSREFWGQSFCVTRDTLDPRPETELLVQIALAGPPPKRILDLGTGTGVILISLLNEWPQARGLGVDLSDKALDVARKNVANHNLSDRCDIQQSDWFQSVSGRFDLITCNPPYISEPEMRGLSRDVLDWEPHLALTPGGDGLSSYRQIADHLARHLSPGGRALFEIGPTQASAVAGILSRAGLHQGTVHKDLDGRDRVVSVQLPENMRDCG